MNNQFTYPKEKIRFAILTFFFAQGLCMASWASRIPVSYTHLTLPTKA